ncbi:hypothetical protein, partial [Flavobacterium sp. H122]|uniref:hypothetical protein n=1 Tax=Flavobacterium sp. H122 TaxID=2529860 RepID=UPI00145C114B
FGNSIDPTAVVVSSNDLDCVVTSSTLTATLSHPNPGIDVKFYGPDPTPNDATDDNGPLIPADQAGQDLTRVVTVGGVYTVITSSAAFPGCTGNARVTVNQTPPNDLTVTCPQSVDSPACSFADQNAVNEAFNTWKAQFSVVGGDGLTQTPTPAEIAALQAPSVCGGEVSVT